MPKASRKSDDSEGHWNGCSVYSIGLLDPVLFCSLTIAVSASRTNTGDGDRDDEGGNLLPRRQRKSYLGKCM